MKIRDKIITLFFTACIFLGAVLTAFLPKQTVSVNEKRALATFPKFTTQKLFSGKWEKEFEGYISDHFPMREGFTALDAYYMLYTGRNGSNEIYKGRDGFLIQTPVKVDDKKLKENLRAINSFAGKTGLKTSLMVVPSTGYELSYKLPQNHLSYNDGEIIKGIYDEAKDMDCIDLSDCLRDSDCYYKTDHHWTSAGAYKAYEKWAENDAVKPYDKDSFNIETTGGFYGTSYSKSALWHTKPDNIELWNYPANISVNIEGKEHDGLFYREHLKEPDKYPVFLDGNHPFETIVNKDNPKGKKVLVIKDSYAHSFVPFMARHCSKIDMVDLRYYFDKVSDLTVRNGYDEVLILYGIHNICETNDLSILE